ncbi:MAG: ATP-dependent metallopeptidase FtsH/Yme1/Tma family protein [Candidatus Dadabacteria bacterium]|nr:MAG: ATP-dependent metallopeptidase FtsH/Yme1/Tma family protein [Candidatus Dadabacteria bacterium]
MQSFYRNLALWFILILFLVVLYNIFHTPPVTAERWTYSDFISRVEKDQVAEVELQDHHVTGKTSDGTAFEVYIPDDPELLSILRTHDVEVEVTPEPEEPLWKPLLISWFPMLLIIGLWVLMIRQMQSGGGKAMSFGKARVRLVNENPQQITFDDVAGVDEAKEELREIVEFLRDPARFTRFGGRIPKGVLLIGSPGTGKTLLAKAVAGEAGVPFFSISGSDFVEMFVGVGASRVRDLFQQARRNAPCIIFIDEIDAVGRHRGAGLGGGHDEREQTLNQLLVEMDGIDSSEGVIIIAATNRPDVLDPALLRPGRFDRRVVVPLPDWKGRKQILEVHINKKHVPIAEDVNVESLARATPGLSGADIENLVNEAALLAARRHNGPAAGEGKVTMADFEEAKDKVLMGAERRSLVLSDEEKRVTAWHEAGHALVAWFQPEADPVHKVTIIPRGMALGLTQQLPEREMHTYSKAYLLTMIRVLMGGRAAEKIAFDSITTGAGNDIERATDLARKMVCEWGMSDTVGPLRFGKGNDEVFLGRDLAAVKDYSEATAVAIDREVRGIVTRCYDDAVKILTEHRDALDRVSEALLERETVSTEDLVALVGREPAFRLERAETEVAQENPDSGAASSRDDEDVPGEEA